MLNKFKSNVFFLFLVQVSNYIAPLLILPYLTRILNVELFGKYATIVAVISLCFVITDFGYSVSGASWVARRRKSTNEINKYISNAIIIKTLLLILMFFSLLVFCFLFFGFDVLYLYIYLIVVSQAFQLNWFFQGIEKMKNITVLISLSKVWFVVSVYFFVQSDSDFDFIFLSLLSSNIISLLITYYFLRVEQFKFSKPDLLQVYKGVVENFSFFVSRVAVAIYTSVSTIVISRFSGLSQAALYSSSEKLYQAGQSATAPFSQVLLPYLSRTKDEKVFYKVVGILFVLVSFVAVFVYAFRIEIFTFIFGLDYLNGVNIFSVFIFCGVVNFLAVNFGYPAFSLYERLDIVNISVIYAAVIQVFILLILYFIGEINAFNVSLSVLCCECFVLFFRLFYFYRLSKERL